MSKSNTRVWSTRTEKGPSAKWTVDWRRIWFSTVRWVSAKAKNFCVSIGILVPVALPLPPDDDALVPLPEATGEDSAALPLEPEVEVWELDSGAPPRLGVCSWMCASCSWRVSFCWIFRLASSGWVGAACTRKKASTVACNLKKINKELEKVTKNKKGLENSWA